MKILVTGASGLIGQHCIKQLSDSEHEIHAISSRSQPAHPKVTWHPTNLLDIQETEKTVASIKADTLIHLAWECGNYNHPVHFDWLASSLSLLKAFQQNGGKRLFTAGSSMEYKWDGTPCDEIDGPFGAETAYGTCKNALGQLASAFAKLTNITHCHGRIFFLCGELQEKQRLVAGMVDALLSGKPFKCNSGYLIRDYLDVADVAKYIVKLVESQKSGVFNIASGKGTRIASIAESAEALVGKKKHILFGPAPEESPIDLVVEARVGRLAAATQMPPSFNLEATLRKIIDWQKHN